MYTRYLEKQILGSLQDGLVVIVYGARQVGKTTLSKVIMESYNKPLYINSDEISQRLKVQNKSSTELLDYFGDADLVVIDEAQRVEDIGLTAKIIHDSLPNIKLLLTGSSSLDLANKTKEPLTGRSKEFTLYPLSLSEIASTNKDKIDAMNKALIYGSYPGIWNLSTAKAKDTLR